MDEFLQEVMRLDTQGDYRGIVRLAAAERGARLPWSIYELLDKHRFFEAYMSAKLFTGTDAANPVAHLAQALGGLLFGNADDLRNGVALLRNLVDRLPPEQQSRLGAMIVQPALDHVVLGDASILVQ